MKKSARLQFSGYLLLVFGLDSGWAVTGDCPQTIPNSGDSISVSSLASKGTNLFGIRTGSKRILRSSDNGASWSEVGPRIPLSDTVLASVPRLEIEVLGARLFLALGTEGLFEASATDTSWTPLQSAFPDPGPVFSLLRSGKLLFASGDSGVYRSVDSGRTWGSIGKGIRKSAYKDIISFADNALFVGVNSTWRGIPSDTGYAWSEVRLRASRIITAHGKYLFGNGVFSGPDGNFYLGRSEDTGLTWTPLPPSQLTLLPTLDGRLLATLDDRILASGDEGETWIDCMSVPVSGMVTYSPGSNGENILFLSKRPIWRPASAPSVSVHPRPPGSAGELRFESGRGEATVHFRVKSAGHTRLALYSLSGKLAKPLEDRFMPEGFATVSFPCDGLKGLYLLIFESGGQRASLPFLVE